MDWQTRASEIDRLLRNIIRRSGLNPRDGYPLYAYRTTSSELADLRESLKAVLILGTRLSLSDQAAFCLFAAEWFRSHHRGGPWKWATILQGGLGLEPFRLLRKRHALYDVTRKGLAWWGLEIIETPSSSRYLATLACQGGLPLHALQNHDAALTRYFRQILRQYERYPHMTPGAIAEFQDGLLPETLRIQIVYELAGTLIQSIARLRHMSQPAEENGTDRIAYLEQHVPNWRFKIPLNLDDQIAERLIHGLLHDQASLDDSGNLAIITSLVTESGQAFVERDVQFSHEIEEGVFADLLSVPREMLQPRMQLQLDADGQRISVAIVAGARLADGRRGFRFSKVPHPSLRGLQTIGPVRLVAVSGTREVAAVAPPKGDSLPDLPWVFEDNAPNQLIGVGSVRTGRRAVRVVIPDGTRWESLAGSTVEQIAVLQTTESEMRQVLRLEGTLQVHHSDHTRNLVRTAVEELRELTFQMRGRRATLGPGGSEVWLNVPIIEQWATDGKTAPESIEQREIQWRPARPGGQWRSLNAFRCLGDVVLRVVHGGEVLYRNRIVVMPSAFQFHLVPGPKASEGRIRLSGLGSAQLHVADEPGVTTSVESNGPGRVDVHVSLTGSRPPLLHFHLTFPDRCAAELAVACPVPWAAVLDATGAVFTGEVSVALDDLDGLRIQAISATARRFRLSERGRRPLGTLIPVSGRGQVYEVPLSLIQSQVAGLLARSADPDGTVVLWLDQPPNTTPLCRINVSRYIGKLTKQVDQHPNRSSRVQSGEEKPQEPTAPVISEVTLLVPEKTMQAIPARRHPIRLAFHPLGYPEAPAPPDAVKTIGPGCWRVDTRRCVQAECQSYLGSFCNTLAVRENALNVRNLSPIHTNDSTFRWPKCYKVF